MISVTAQVRCLFFICLCALTSVPAFAQLSEKDTEQLEESVVRILAVSSRGVSTGSAVVVNRDGYIATNFHVIEGAGDIRVADIKNNDLVEIESIAWSSKGKDLAILKLAKPLGKPAVFSSQIPPKGAGVTAIGYPGVADRAVSNKDGLLGLPMAKEATLTKGVIGRTFDGPWDNGDGETVRIVQHSAQINGGNSGGPLFDECGRVIGVNTQGATRQSSGAAATGVFFASNANEIIDALSAQSIGFRRAGAVCELNASSWDSQVWVLVALSIASMAVAIYALRRPVQYAV